jgi:hypothetical protein
MRKLGVDNVVDLIKLGATMGLVNIEIHRETSETEPDPKRTADRATHQQNPRSNRLPPQASR